jgi:cytochrome c biogenesis protein CcmG, thiol:disulfide interchange protein DsbE
LVNARGNLLYWIAGAIIVGVVLAVYFRNGGAPVSGPASLAGKPAPSFTVNSLSGSDAGLDNYRGRIVVMNLWASWCPPCRAEMPDLQRLYVAYRSRNVVVIGVDQGESAQQVSAFVRSLDIHYPILLDQQQQYGRVYAALGLPTTIVIDRRGTVVRGFDGPLSFAQMVSAISPLLNSHS